MKDEDEDILVGRDENDDAHEGPCDSHNQRLEQQLRRFMPLGVYTSNDDDDDDDDKKPQGQHEGGSFLHYGYDDVDGSLRGSPTPTL
jgi:hypothetical protein